MLRTARREQRFSRIVDGVVEKGLMMFYGEGQHRLVVNLMVLHLWMPWYGCALTIVVAGCNLCTNTKPWG